MSEVESRKAKAGGAKPRSEFEGPLRMVGVWAAAGAHV